MMMIIMIIIIIIMIIMIIIMIIIIIIMIVIMMIIMIIRMVIMIIMVQSERSRRGNMYSASDSVCLLRGSGNLVQGVTLARSVRGASQTPFSAPGAGQSRQMCFGCGSDSSSTR